MTAKKTGRGTEKRILGFAWLGNSKQANTFCREWSREIGVSKGIHGNPVHFTPKINLPTNFKVYSIFMTSS